mmetsp:Transcript_61271/g.145875  ORF Transcript_61271/g.145875 Transcript_61271/m.145875 type:complete len:427 (-) Transcript_61271:247-1527(-)
MAPLDRMSLRGSKPLESSVSMPKIDQSAAPSGRRKGAGEAPLVEHHHFHFHYGHKGEDQSTKIPLAGDLQCTVPLVSHAMPSAEDGDSAGGSAKPPQRGTSLPALPQNNASASRSVASMEWRVGAPPRLRKKQTDRQVSPKASPQSMPRVLPPAGSSALADGGSGGSNMQPQPGEGNADAALHQKRPLKDALKRLYNERVKEAPSPWTPAPVTPAMLLPQTEVRRRPRLETMDTKAPSHMPSSSSLEQVDGPLASPSGSSSHATPAAALKSLKSFEAMDTMQLWSSYNLAKSNSDSRLKRPPGWIPKGDRRQVAREQSQARRLQRRKECQRHMSEMEDGDTKRRYVEGMLSPVNRSSSPHQQQHHIHERNKGGVFDDEPSWKEKQEIRKGLQSARNISSALQECSRQRQELVKMQHVLKKVEGLRV